MDELDRLAIITACGILLSHLEYPGSQSPENLEGAIQILENCRALLREKTGGRLPALPATPALGSSVHRRRER